MSSRGFLVFAEGEQYARQAYLLALSLKFKNNYPVSIVTNEAVKDNIFDQVISYDTADTGRYRTSIRSRAYELSPYDETIVLDSDCIVLTCLDYFWNLMHRDLYYPTSVYSYRKELVTNDFYRKTFTANSLPNCYNAFFYFKKTEVNKTFYDLLNLINENWKEFYTAHCKVHTPTEPSMDVNTAIALKISGYKETSLTAPFLVHMKPLIQNWKQPSEMWTHKLGVYVNQYCQVKLGSYTQDTVLHYVEDDFVTDTIIERFEKCAIL